MIGTLALIRDLGFHNFQATSRFGWKARLKLIVYQASQHAEAVNLVASELQYLGRLCGTAAYSSLDRCSCCPSSLHDMGR
jgi:hypothetical protein